MIPYILAIVRCYFDKFRRFFDFDSVFGLFLVKLNRLQHGVSPR